MRVGILSQYYDPEPGPAALPAVLARGLAERGHEVRVLTAVPNYPSGRVADGYENRRVQEQMLGDGIAVRRVGLYPSHDGSGVRRGLTYTSFGLNALASGSAFLSDCDVVWASNSPVTNSWPIEGVVRRGRTPVVLHVLDLWPDNVASSGMLPGGVIGRLCLSSLDYWTGRLYRLASRVLSISPGIADLLEDRGVPRAKVHYAPLWADESVYRSMSPSASLPAGDSGVIRVAYVGNLGRAQRIDLLLEAMAHVDAGEIECWIAGSGTEEDHLVGLARDLNLRVRFLGRLAPADAANVLAGSHFHYVGLKDDALARVTMPSKVQTSLAMGRAIVTSVQGDVAHLVRQNQVGVTASTGSVDGLTRALKQCVQLGAAGASDMGQRARCLYDREFSIAKGLDRIEGHLEVARNQGVAQ